jgi:predicted homoserine dehydrogenase-like protein
MYKPFHLIGMELGISVLSAALRGEPTGQPRGFAADAVAIAKRDLAPGDELDGEGGYAVWGKCLPAARSVALGALPIGLAKGIRIRRPVPRGTILTRDDVEPTAPGAATELRAETEALLQG